jgi:hypothetical protein
MTTLPPRRVVGNVYVIRSAIGNENATMNTKGELVLSLEKLERETSLELATSTLARLRSTN